MLQRLFVAPAIAAILMPLVPDLSRAEVILEDKGLYKKEKWNISKRYDDLDNPRDAPGIITKGRDPARPSGPAVDFEETPGTSNPDARGED